MRMKTIKRLFVLLLLSVTLLTLASCGEVEIVHDEAEIMTAAEDLISRSVTWNHIFFIDGIPVLEGGREQGIYREADPSYLASFGMSKITDVITYGKTVFSSSMMQLFDETLFQSIKNEVGGVASSAVCYDFIEKKDGVSHFICVMVDPDESPRFYASEVVYHYETMQITYNLNYHATVTLTVSGVGENEGEERELRVNLLQENGVWYLDGYTFVVFPKAEE